MSKAGQLTEKESQLQKQVQQFESQYKQWQSMVEAEKQRANKLANSTSSLNLRASADSVQLVDSVDAASEEVKKRKDYLVARLEQAEAVCDSQQKCTGTD